MGGKAKSSRSRRDSKPANKTGAKKPARSHRPNKRAIGSGLKESSARWLRRQASDPFVRAAKAQGYRSRSAFKLSEIDDRFKIFARGRAVVDLGAAPGGWSQVAAERVAANTVKGGSVLAVDLSPLDPIPGVTVVCMDVESDAVVDNIRRMAPGGVDAVISDMAPPATGHRETDHVRTVALADAALALALGVLKPGGAFVAKVTQGGSGKELLMALQRRFGVVRHFKPKASRKESPETYVVAIGLKPPN